MAAEEQECCVLGICCDATLRLEALAEQLKSALHLNNHQATEIATFIRGHYDLAPKGLLQPLLDYIAAEAREYPYQQM